MSKIVSTPIGIVTSGRVDKSDDHWGAVESTIALDNKLYSPEALLELDSFSHIEVVFFFHKVPPKKVHTSARHPRGNNDWPLVGIFSQRAKARPNRLGVSRCELLAIHDLTLHVRGLDAIDGSPVLDIKPYLEEFAPKGEVRQPEWSHEIMKEYYLGSTPKKKN